MLEKQYEDQQQEKFRRQDVREKQKLKKLEQKKDKNKKILHAQHHQMMEKYIKIMQEEKIEGEIIKRRAEESIRKEAEKQIRIK